MSDDNTSQDACPIGEAADLVGLSIDALRFYEREELLVGPIRRTAGGRRLYSAVDIDWLRICVKLRESGMPLAKMRAFARLVREGPGNEAQRLELLDEQRRHVDAQIRALEACREVIERKVDVYSRHVRAGTARGLWAPGDGD